MQLLACRVRSMHRVLNEAPIDSSICTLGDRVQRFVLTEQCQMTTHRLDMCMRAN